MPDLTLGLERAASTTTVALDPTVKALGVVALLNDLSSEVAVRTVKAGVIGLIEGLAESTATLLRVVSGVLADRVGKKKALALCGYGLSGFTKRCCSSPQAVRACSYLLLRRFPGAFALMRRSLRPSAVRSA